MKTKDDCYFYLGATTLNLKKKKSSMFYQHPVYCNQLGQAVSYYWGLLKSPTYTALNKFHSSQKNGPAQPKLRKQSLSYKVYLIDVFMLLLLQLLPTLSAVVKLQHAFSSIDSHFKSKETEKENSNPMM